MTNLSLVPTSPIEDHPLLRSQKMSDTKIERMPNPLRQMYLADKGCVGLYLRVGSSGTKSWVLDYYDHNKRRQKYTIGRISHWNTLRARQECRRLQGYIADGGDPRADKLHKREAREYRLGVFVLLPEIGIPKSQADIVIRTFRKFANTSMQELTVNDLEKWRKTLINRGVQNGTLNRYRVAIRSVLNRAVKVGMLDKNPLDGWSPLPVHTELRTRYLDLHEKARLEAALDHPATPEYLADIVRIALRTAMRRNEILSLRWKDVFLGPSPHINIRATVSKNKKSRAIPLNDSLVELFTDRKEGTDTDRGPDSLIFPSPSNGKQIQTLKTAWKSLLKRADIQEFRFHDLRHTSLSYLAMAGVEPYTMMAIAGHSSLRMVSRYAHLSPDTLAAALKKLD